MTIPCPLGCGFRDAPHRVGNHVRFCLTPRTMKRLTEIGSAVRQPDGCLLWNGRPERNGSIKSRRPYVVAFEIGHGPIPAGRIVCHTCDVPGCIEPSHLFAGTYADNSRDASRKGRLAGAVTWTREQRLAAGLDGSKARAARLAKRAIARVGIGPICGGRV